MRCLSVLSAYEFKVFEASFDDGGVLPNGFVVLPVSESAADIFARLKVNLAKKTAARLQHLARHKST
jgi:hypothetical protein